MLMTNKVLVLSPIPASCPPRMSTMGLIIGMANNSPRAKEQLYDETAPYCYAWLLKQVSKKEADELLYEVFVYAFKHFDKYNPSVPLIGWMNILTQMIFKKTYPNKEIII